MSAKGHVCRRFSSFTSLVNELTAKPRRSLPTDAVTEAKERLVQSSFKTNVSKQKIQRKLLAFDRAVSCRGLQAEERIYGRMHKFEPRNSVLWLIKELQVAKEANLPVHHAQHQSGQLNLKLWDTKTPAETPQEKFWSGLRYYRGVQHNCFPPALGPEVAFLGHSNVGKSFLLNVLTKSAVAPAKNHSGVTGNVHFYRSESRRVFFVDTPGYGFANAKEKTKESWKALLKAYLLDRASKQQQMHAVKGSNFISTLVSTPGLKRVFLLIAANNGLKQIDIEQLDLLESNRVPFSVVLTKCDLLPTVMLAQRATVIDHLLDRYKFAQGYSLEQANCKPVESLRCMMVSSITDAGIPQLRNCIFKLVG